MFFSREGRDLGVAFQDPPGCQASSRGEAKDSAVLPSRDADILEPTEWLKGSQTSSGVWREDTGLLSNERNRARVPYSLLMDSWPTHGGWVGSGGGLVSNL